MKKIVSTFLTPALACALVFGITACAPVITINTKTLDTTEFAADAPVITDSEKTFYLNSLEDVRTYPVYFIGDSDV